MPTSQSTDPPHAENVQAVVARLRDMARGERRNADAFERGSDGHLYLLDVATAHDRAAELLTQLEQQVRTLTEALSWYADSRNYWYRYCLEGTRRTWITSAQEDCGARARAALRVLKTP
jgi:hypothetical protein